MPKPANIVARQKARELLAAGAPVSLVAQTLGKNKNTIYKWMAHGPFAERLRAEIERDMSGTRRALGQVARKAIASADESLNQLQRTRDNPGETSAARDRAANRLLNHAYKWGRVVDLELESGEACGSSTFLNGDEVPIDYVRENENLVHKLHQATDVMMRLEKLLMDAKVPLSSNLPGLVHWMGFHEYTTYLEKAYLAQSELFRESREEAEAEQTDETEEEEDADPVDPELAERERRDAERERKDKERRAAFRRAEIDGTPPPYEHPDDEDDDDEIEAVEEEPAEKDDAQPKSGKNKRKGSPSASAQSQPSQPSQTPPLNPIQALNAAIAANPELKKQQEEILRKQSQVYPRISLY